MTSHILIKIGSDNAILPDGTKPLPDAVLTNFQLSLEKRTSMKILWNDNNSDLIKRI